MGQVHYRVRDAVAVLTLDNPPVNAASQGLRAGIVEGIARAAQDSAAHAVVLIGAGRSFVAGADIREFGQPPQAPHFPEVLAALEGSAKPVVAALHGTALGGGLEFALACHYRVALASARCGLPEVNLGLLPGGGGTQRLPRLAGAEKGLELILSGKPIDAAEAAALGVVDDVFEGTDPAVLETRAVAFAGARAAQGGSHPRVRDRSAQAPDGLFDRVRERNARRWKGLLAPWRIVDCVQAACEKSFDEGLAIERAHFVELRDSPQSAALRHAFFAEREAARVPGLPRDVQPRAVHRAAVIGAGTMGGGIAMCFANAGIPVQILDLKPEALEQGLQRVRDHYATSVRRGSTAPERAQQALSRIQAVSDYAAIAQADLVVEAVFEDLSVKQAVFAELDRVMKPGAILASNTSTLDIDAIAAATQRPQDVIGTHFFSPANVMRLQENVRGRASGADVIATVMDLAKRLNKVPVLAGNAFGFIGNRMLYAYGRECDFLLEEGATPWQIDAALQDFGFAMGLYRMRDLAGLDVGWRVRQAQAPSRDPALRYSPVADRICEQGHFGQKTGRGYYRYEGREAHPEPETEALIRAVARELGIEQRPVDAQGVVRRALCALVNEGARILGEGIAVRASDLDVTWIHGYGFPRHQGGPMYWAQQQGLAQVLEWVRGFEAGVGPQWWPSPVLVAAATRNDWT